MIILCLVFILLIFTLIIIINRTREKFTPELKTNIGNQLCFYFSDLGKCIYNQKDFEYTSNLKKSFFFKDLPHTIKYTPELFNIHQQIKGLPKRVTQGGHGNWEIIDNDMLLFWKSMKPLIHKILDTALTKNSLRTTIDAPVIHFRCADTPFNKHPNYKFQYYRFFKDALTLIEKKNNKKYNKVYICYNNTWISTKENQNSCNIYFENLVKYIKSLGYEVFHSNKDVMTDFATMFYAPAVISTSSSLSFFAGYFGAKTFISSGFYSSKNTCTLCDDWLFKGYDLEHTLVQDYHDTNTVIDILKK